MLGSLAGICLVLAIVVPWWASVDVFPNGTRIPKVGFAVVGGRVVRGWVVGAVLLMVALVLLWALRVSRRRDPARRHDDPFLRSARRRLVALPVVLAALSGGGAAFDDFITSANYVALQPTGPEGCLVVVREGAFLFSGTGDAYVLPGGHGVARRVGTWNVDDGARPVAKGDYRLTWAADLGVLFLLGTVGESVLEPVQEIDCR